VITDPDFKEAPRNYFEIFEIAPIDRFGVKGNGIGLATVKKNSGSFRRYYIC
jgi:hypothetical protein